MSVELKPGYLCLNGYKQTEVGVIPEDWDITELSEKARVVDSLHQTPIFSNDGYPMVRVTDIKTGNLKLSNTLNVSGIIFEIFTKNYKPKRGDIVLSRVGSYGVSSFVETDELFCMGQNTVVIECKIPSRFLYYILNSQGIRKQIEDASFGTGYKSLSLKGIKSLRIPLPSTKAEQEAIAGALRDTDALIESLEQIISKKRQIKQGAMQELLRSKDGCEVKMLCEVSSLKGRIGWQGLKQTEFTTNQDEPYLITGMNFKDGAIRWNEVYHISEERYEIAKEIQLKADDVLMTKDGTIGKMLYIDSIPYPEKASLNSHLLLFRPIRESYFPKYLYYQLTSKRFADFIELSKSGTTFFGISQTSVGKYPVLLPPMEEQILIATTLSDMDAEIAALETQLAKIQSLKQGMMHNLLTGRIRLL